jgi:hypothetical protein
MVTKLFATLRTNCIFREAVEAGASSELELALAGEYKVLLIVTSVCLAGFVRQVSKKKQDKSVAARVRALLHTFTRRRQLPGLLSIELLTIALFRGPRQFELRGQHLAHSTPAAQSLHRAELTTDPSSHSSSLMESFQSQARYFA